MQKAYRLNEDDARKLSFLYKQSEIENRYSVLPDFGKPESEWEFVEPDAGEKCLNSRIDLFESNALALSVAAIKECVKNFIEPEEITHLITVSCTGMSAPGLDLQIAEDLGLSNKVFRTSVNFMGCYAAIHAMKIGKMICDSTSNAKVIIVCTELCTIHFQKHFTLDNAASSLLFGDGSAALLLSNSITSPNALKVKSFYSEISYKGKNDMSWQISNTGFLMKLSAYIPQLIQEDIAALVKSALDEGNLDQSDITHWCIHPGGRKILEVIKSKLSLSAEDLSCSKSVLSKYGNMSSPTILFVLKEIMEGTKHRAANVFGVAFGPGLTMETFIASKA
ncbi:chalcone synthase [Segetibacter aerophilus]|uniref:Chalcone synthase n=2 Tax=Segetibacter aerophilus TaxID=670293 RepID=A0A512BFG4_9BACT|nr:chalcone synthase [Segetibacter aerophilus]